jgi:hypothetical protein
LEKFYANNHEIIVNSTTSTNTNDLSGTGQLKITSSGQIAEIEFHNIDLKNITGEWFIEDGTILSPVDTEPIKIYPNNNSNGEAYFYADSIKIAKNISDVYELQIKGVIEWNLPLPVDSTEIGKVKTDSKWYSYDNYKLLGSVNLAPGNNFKLLEPYNHLLQLNTSSEFSVVNNNFNVFFDGKVYLPTNVKDNDDLRIGIPFEGQTQLYYIETQNDSNINNISLIENTGFELSPEKIIIDFSDEVSPLKFASTPDWKGVYFEEFSLLSKILLDNSGQVILNNQVELSFSLSNSTDFKCWTTLNGLDFKIESDFDNSVSEFNTFSGAITNLNIDIENNILSDSELNGYIIIPLISETEHFNFSISLSEDGFNTGYLDESLENYSFIFNPDGGEQQLEITLLNPYFSENEKLETSISVSWTSLNLSFTSIPYFNIWGSGAIGFITPNGSTNLVNQITGYLNEFQLTSNVLGCGSSEGAYGFGTTAVIVMAENISGGDDGQPELNLYSVCPNIYAPFVNEGDYNPTDSTSLQNALNEINEYISSLEDLNSQVTGLSELSGDFSEDANNMLNSTSLNSSGNAFNPEDFENGENIIPEDTVQVLTVENIILILNTVKNFLPVEQKVKVDQLLDVIEDLSENEIILLFMEFGDINEVIKQLAKQKLTEILTQATDLVNEKTAEVNNLIVQKINFQVGKIDLVVDSVVNSVLNQISDQIINTVQTEAIDVETIVTSIITATGNGLKITLKNSIHTSVNENLTFPITNFIQTQVADSLNAFIMNKIGGLGFELIDNGLNANLDLDLGPALTSIGQNLVNGVKDADIQATIINIFNDLIQGITVDILIDNIMLEAEDLILEAISQQLLNAVADSEFLQQVGGQLLANIDLDFDNIGEKLMNGQIDQIIKFDFSHIKVETDVAEFEANVKFLKGDPTWGDCFMADVEALIKKPDPAFGANASFINGKVNGTSFWFLELGVSGLKAPMTPIPISLDGVQGRVFHHMSYNEGNQYLPDPNTLFGAALQMYFFDTGSQGAIVKFDLTGEVTILIGSFELEMRGNVYTGNSDMISLAQGDGFLNYNSANKHLLGQFNAHTNTSPLLCAEGTFGVDIKSASDWNLYMGKQISPITVQTLCSSNFSTTGWVDINQTGMNLGLNMNYVINAQSPWFVITDNRSIQFFADLGFIFDSYAALTWNPLAVQEAMLEATAWANIGANWTNSATNNSGTLNFINAYLYGLLTFSTVPETQLYGYMYGSVEVFDLINFNFDLEVDKTF